MRVSLNNPQADFLALPHKFRAYVGGFGAGKTWAGCTAMCSRYYSQPRVNQAYYAPSYPHIRDIFFQTIEEVAHGWQLRCDVRESNKEVHFYTGTKYRGTTICRSMERPASIVGYKVGHAMIDELDTMAPSKAQEAWRKIIARLRWDGASNGADVTTTPEGFRETHRLFVAQIAEDDAKRIADPDYAATRGEPLRTLYGIVHASTRDNAANLQHGYIQSLIDTYPAELIEAYIEGKFCNLTSGTVYNKYNRDACDSAETLKPGEPAFVGMDFNIGKMAATVYVQRPDGWHAVMEAHDVFDTPAMAGLLRERLGERRIVVYPDASGRSASTKDASTSDIAILQRARFEVRANPSNPRVRDRVLAVNKQFEAGRLWINSRACPTVAKCLEQQAYDASGEPDKSGGFDHQNDATTYPIAYENPIVRPVSRIRMAGV